MAVLAGRHHMRIGITSNGRIRLLTKDTKLNLPQGKWSFVCVFGKWIVCSCDFFPYGTCNSDNAQYSKTPSLRSLGFEDEDEDEAPHERYGAFDRTRTCDPGIKNPLLYPAELTDAE
jgi:hypothetical protein